MSSITAVPKGVVNVFINIFGNGKGGWQAIANSIAGVAVVLALKKAQKMGLKKVGQALIMLILEKALFAGETLNKELEKEAIKTHDDLFTLPYHAPMEIGFPEEGQSAEKLLATLREFKTGDLDPATGKTFAYVYTPFEKAGEKLNEDAVKIFGNYNALNPSAFPSLRKMEVEVVEMCKFMTGDIKGVTGSMTAGGTESILMAVKVAREYGRKQLGIEEPECVLPVSAHPAFAKAGHYLGVKMVWCDVHAETQACDMKSMKAAINANTVLLVGSAPSYPCGTMDPIKDIAALADRKKLLCHVDACYGGFVIPWLEKIGRDIPPWDFRTKGVTSISMDCHKYGFTTKGASCVMYRNRELRKLQYFAFTQWTGGLFVSPSMLGTRAGGPIASTWCTMHYYGQNGYKEICRKLIETTDYLREEVSKMPGIKVLGSPCMCSMGIVSTDKDINLFAVADQMEKLGGWKMEQNTTPQGLHFTVLPPHAAVKELLIEHMAEGIKIVKSDPKKYANEGSAATYGMVAKIPDDAIVDKFMVQLMDVLYVPDARVKAAK